MVPFFDFAIGLRMLDSGQHMLNRIFRQEFVESTLIFPIFIRLVGKELFAMISDYLSDPRTWWIASCDMCLPYLCSIICSEAVQA